MDELVTISVKQLKKLKLDVERLKHEVSHTNKCLREKNLELDALHYVWSDNGRPNGMHRWIEGELTEDLVSRAELQVKRMRTWLNKSKRGK